MNINHEHKIIWWAAERCGTKALAHIFSKLGFIFYHNLEHYKNGLPSSYQSHEIKTPEEFSDYEVIFSTRNPYDRVLSLYNNFTNVGKNNLYTKDNHENFIKKYEVFLEELFLITGHNKPILNNYIKKYSFDDKIPDKIIRIESLIEDLSKLKFVTDSEIWKSGYIHDYLMNNEYIVRRHFKYNQVYTPLGAKLVYENHIKHFILGKYDPFSFTMKNISNEEKMRFIHNNLH